MKRYAILSGIYEATTSPQFFQKSLVEFVDFLKSDFGGAWKDEELLVTGNISWEFCQFLQTRLQDYDFVLVYRCKSSLGTEKDFSDKLKNFLGEKCFYIKSTGEDVVKYEV